VVATDPDFTNVHDGNRRITSSSPAGGDLNSFTQRTRRSEILLHVVHILVPGGNGVASAAIASGDAVG
jgi:hypothetical protein